MRFKFFIAWITPRCKIVSNKLDLLGEPSAYDNVVVIKTKRQRLAVK